MLLLLLLSASFCSLGIFSGWRDLQAKIFRLWPIRATRQPIRVCFQFHPGSVFTDAQKDVLTATRDSMKEFLSMLLAVDPYPGTITWTDTISHDEFTAPNSDLLIVINSDPKLEASATTRVYPEDIDCPATNLGRRFVAAITINPAKIPSAAETFWARNDRTFFMTLLHEAIHALGFHATAIDCWNDGLDGNTRRIVRTQPYDDHEDPDSAVNIPWVQTESAKKVVAEQFNSSAGLPLQALDHGSTEASNGEAHVRPVIFPEDVLQSTSGSWRVLSKVSISILEGMGWYDVNKSLTEPHYFANDGHQKTSLLTNYPAKELAANHLCEDVGDVRCFVNPRLTGTCEGVEQLDCGGINEPPCSFFPEDDRPDGAGKTVLGRVDYEGVPIVLPYVHCGMESSKIPEDYKPAFGEHSYCAVSTLNNEDHPVASCYEMSCEDGVLSVKVGDEVQECAKPGENIRFEGMSGFVTCPDAADICEKEEEDEDLSVLEMGLIAGGGVVVVVGIAGTVWFIVYRRRKNQPERDEQSVGTDAREPVLTTPALLANES